MPTKKNVRASVLFTGRVMAGLVLLVMVFGTVPAISEPSKRIVFFAPTSKNNTYWPQVFSVMRSVARDLHVALDIYTFDVENRFAKHVKGVQILKEKPKPGGAIFSVAFGNSRPLLEAAEELEIPVFIQGPVFPFELPHLGNKPRKKFTMWIGYFFQDEFNKGYLLGKELLKTTHETLPDHGGKRLKVAGVGGDPSWFGSELREKGLAKAVKEDPSAVMLQVVPTHWTEEEAMTKTTLLFGRYPDLSVVWAASDQLGIGVSKAFEKMGKTPGKDLFTGGLDLSLNGLDHVKQGKLVATVAGTMIDYAEVLIYLYDYVHGKDFADEVGTVIHSPIHTVTRENVDQFIRFYMSYERIDYSGLSKVLNPDRIRYDFSMKHLVAF